MFIQTEQTPNPSSLKFLPGCEVMKRGTAEFKNTDEAAASPLAGRIFRIHGVAGVFLGGDFITVTKTDAARWAALEPMILGAIMEYFATGQDVLHGGDVPAASGDDDEIVRKIKELLDVRIRPVVAQDGGDIVFDSFRDGVVYLHLRGACAGCPGAAATLKTGVESVLRHFIPEVKEVRAVK
ncbi:MAG: NifU N-terminal domain-containing protein [Pseudomonadota bacterium]